MMTEGLFEVESTTDRTAARGTFITKLSPEGLARAGIESSARFVAVVRNDKAAICKLAIDESVSDGVCQLDRNIRERLGIREGDQDKKVEIRPLVGEPTQGWTLVRRLVQCLFKPRNHFLELASPYYLYAERNLCLMHNDSAKLLGVDEGDYVRLFAAVPREGTANGAFQVKSISRRALFRGQQRQPDSMDVEPPVTDIKDVSICLDKDARQELEIPDRTAIPILVQVDIWRAFLSRLLFYGLTFLVAYLSIESVLGGLLHSFHPRPELRAGLALAGSVGLALLVSWIDFKGKVQY